MGPGSHGFRSRAERPIAPLSTFTAIAPSPSTLMAAFDVDMDEPVVEGPQIAQDNVQT